MYEHKYLFPLHRSEPRGNGPKELVALLGDCSRRNSGNLPAAKSWRRGNIFSDLVIARNTRGQQSKGHFALRGSALYIFRLSPSALFFEALRLAATLAIPQIAYLHLLR